MGGATPVLLKVSLFIKVGVATLKTLPRPILFLFQIALYQGFPMMYHLFHNSMWKVVRIAKTSDCKTLLILKWPPLYTNWSNFLQNKHLSSIHNYFFVFWELSSLEVDHKVLILPQRQCQSGKSSRRKGQLTKCTKYRIPELR